MFDTKAAKKYARKYLAMKKCDAKAKELRKELEQEKDPFIEHMMSEELDKLSLKGGITLEVKEEIWAKAVARNEFDKPDHPTIVKALYAAGLGDMVAEKRYNHQSLSSYLRELEKSEKPLPEELKGAIAPTSKFKLVVKKLT